MRGFSRMGPGGRTNGGLYWYWKVLGGNVTVSTWRGTLKSPAGLLGGQNGNRFRLGWMGLMGVSPPEYMGASIVVADSITAGEELGMGEGQ